MRLCCFKESTLLWVFKANIITASKLFDNLNQKLFNKI